MEEAGFNPCTKELAFQPTTFADLVIRTSDGYTLHVHKAVMSRGCTIWSDVLGTVSLQGEAVDVEETWEQLRPHMLFLYPEGAQGAPGKAFAEGWAEPAAGPGILDDMTPGNIRTFLEVSRKYGCDGLLSCCSGYLCSQHFKLTPDVSGATSVITCLALAYEFSLVKPIKKSTNFFLAHLKELATSLESVCNRKSATSDLGSLPPAQLAELVASLTITAGRAQASCRPVQVAYST